LGIDLLVVAAWKWLVSSENIEGLVPTIRLVHAIGISVHGVVGTNPPDHILGILKGLIGGICCGRKIVVVIVVIVVL